jgi:hypothetical protein
MAQRRQGKTSSIQIQRVSLRRLEEGPPEIRPEHLFEDVPEITHSAELQVLKALKPCIMMLILNPDPLLYL